MPITIASLHLYPVKGCRAVDVTSITTSPDGLLVGDRAAMIVDASTGRFISQRHEPRLTQLIASLTEGGLHLAWEGRPSINVIRNAVALPRQVTVWDDTFDADDAGDAAADWISTAIDRPARLVWLRQVSNRALDSFWAGSDGVTTSFADLAPVLLTNIASLDELNDRRCTEGRSPIAMARFRPNVVVSGLQAFGEDGVAALQTLDRRLTLKLIKPCARCSVPELDPQTGDASEDDVLRSLAGFRTQSNRRGTRGIMFGQNAIVQAGAGGVLRVGETLEVVT
jgi:uncharacterized protein